MLNPSIKYLGHIIDSSGISVDNEKVEAVVSYPIPRNVKEVRAFLGLVQFYRKFLRNCSRIAAPLHALTKRDVAYVWSTDCQNAFDQLKLALSTCTSCIEVS